MVQKSLGMKYDVTFNSENIVYLHMNNENSMFNDANKTEF